MARGNDEKVSTGSPRRLETSVMPHTPPPEVKEFRPGYKEDRHYPPPVPSGRNANILPMIAATIVEEKEGEEIEETMRRVIEKDISEFTGTDEIHYYFRSNHGGLEIEYPDGAREEFIVDDSSLRSCLTRSDGKKEDRLYLQFPNGFYIDPYQGLDPVHTERKRLREQMSRGQKLAANAPDLYEREDDSSGGSSFGSIFGGDGSIFGGGMFDTNGDAGGD